MTRLHLRPLFALMLCVVVLLLPALRLGVLVTAPASAALSGATLPDEDDRDDTLVAVAKAPQPARYKIPAVGHLALVPAQAERATPLPCDAPSERASVNGCGAVLRC